VDSVKPRARFPDLRAEPCPGACQKTWTWGVRYTLGRGSASQSAKHTLRFSQTDHSV
jgi:hypothetical protein